MELGHDVLNVSPVMPHELDRVYTLRGIGVENWVAARPASPFEEVARAIAAEPQVLATAITRPVRALEMRVFWTRLRTLAARALADWLPEVVLVGHDMAAAWASELPAELPAVLNSQNLTWRWYESRAVGAGAAHKAILRAEGWRFRRHVLAMLPRFHSAVVVSTLEADELRALTPIKVDLIPNGVDTHALRPAPEGPGPPRVLFTGTMNYLPNDQGIRWFIRDVWPLVRLHMPEAQLDVVGKDPLRRLLDLNGVDGVAVHGSVPSMAPFFAGTHVVAVPIRSGAGTRVKVIEAMAAGRAIVSTHLGCEGLVGLEEGRHALVADEPPAFANHVVHLLRERETRAHMAAEARRLAESTYDWRPLGEQLEQVLLDALAR